MLLKGCQEGKGTPRLAEVKMPQVRGVGGSVRKDGRRHRRDRNADR